MPSITQKRADLRAQLLTSGHYHRLVREYAYPLPIVMDGRPSVACSEGDAWGFFQGLHASISAMGFVTVTGQVTAEHQDAGDQFRVLTDWFGQGTSGVKSLIMRTVCRCRGTLADFVTEGVEFSELRIPVAAEL